MVVERGAKEEVTESSLRDTLAEMSAEARNQWGSRLKVFKLLKRKTLATSEANKLVKCGERQNGWESWRLLNLRYEPQSGIRKAHEFRQLMQLMNKACTTPVDTVQLIM